MKHLDVQRAVHNSVTTAIRKARNFQVVTIQGPDPADPLTAACLVQDSPNPINQVQQSDPNLTAGYQMLVGIVGGNYANAQMLTWAPYLDGKVSTVHVNGAQQ